MGAKVISATDITQRLDELPTLPTIVYELSQVINDPMSSTSDVEKLMANDQSLTTKVLKLVNSAYYAIPGGVSSLGRAIAYIGYDTIHQLVLSASILEALEVKKPCEFDINEFWKHCLGVAVAAETIAKFSRHPTPADLFTCGLVHDMGKVALLTLETDVMMSIVNFAKENGVSYFEAEQEMGQVPHTRIGQLLAEKWRLPAQIAAVVKYHHQQDPMRRVGLTHEFNNNVDIVFLANLFTHALKFGDSGHNKVSGAPKDVMKRLTIDPEKDFKPLLHQIRDSLEHANEFMRVLGSS